MIKCRVFLCVAFCAFSAVPNVASAIPVLNESAVFPDPGDFIPAYAKSNIWKFAADDEYVVAAMWQPKLGDPQRVFAYRADTHELAHILEGVAPDGMGVESFGSSVAVSGNLAVVGSRNEHFQSPDGIRYNAGAAHVFDLTTGQQIARLVADEPSGNASFGDAVAIDGNNVLVGGRNGVAYLFDALSGEELAEFRPENPQSLFGSFLAIDGNLALISNFSEYGYAEPYEVVDVFDITTRSKISTLVASDYADDDGFGYALDLDGETAIVGSFRHNENVGASYVFNATTGEQLAKLEHPLATRGYFGSEVAIDGSLAVVGAPSDSQLGLGAGTAFVYDWTKETAITQLVPSDFGVRHFFGAHAFLNGGTIVVADGTGANFYSFQIPEPSTIWLAMIANIFHCFPCRYRQS